MEAQDLTIKKITEAIRNGETSLSDVVSLYTNNIKEKNKELNAYLEVFSDVDEQIKALEKKDKNLPLYGVPIAVKDNILIEGKTCSAASKILENYTATYDATVIKALRDAGAIFLGRTNMDEFAMGGSTENSAFGFSKNPHDTSRVPGGSSGGSAAAVAGNLAPVALGSDTGGSIRQPASFCGIVGMKPTYGTVSRFGLIAMASSLDQIGPLTKTVDDARILFDVLSQEDKNDSTNKRERFGKETHSKKLAYPKKFLQEGVDKDVLENFEEAITNLKKEGYTIEEIDLPTLSYSLSMYYIIMPAESSSNLARFDGIKYGLSVKGDSSIERYFNTRGEGFGAEVRRRIMLGTYVLSSGYYDAYYQKALNAKKALQSEFARVFETYDGILMPTSPTPAFKIGEKTDNPLHMYLADIFTVSANIAGVPAISVPTGEVARDGKALPCGTQILAPWFSEQTLFTIARDLERSYG